jgi:hypothetical protein
MYGSVANTNDCKKTDKATKIGAKLAVQEINEIYGLELKHKTKMSHSSLGKTPKRLQNCSIAPDGGFVLDGDVVILVSEAKDNKDSGNAIERWYHKLFVVRKFFNKEVSFVTFASGDIRETSPIYTKLYPAHSEGDGSINSFTVNKNSLFLKEEWTVEEVKEIVKESLIKALNL